MLPAQFAKELEAASDGNSLANSFELPLWHREGYQTDRCSVSATILRRDELHWTATDLPNIVSPSEIAGSSECIAIIFTSNVAN
jgi:hypothetical protein